MNRPVKVQGTKYRNTNTASISVRLDIDHSSGLKILEVSRVSQDVQSMRPVIFKTATPATQSSVLIEFVHEDRANVSHAFAPRKLSCLFLNLPSLPSFSQFKPQFSDLSYQEARLLHINAVDHL